MADDAIHLMKWKNRKHSTRKENVLILCVCFVCPEDNRLTNDILFGSASQHLEQGPGVERPALGRWLLLHQVKDIVPGEGSQRAARQQAGQCLWTEADVRAVRPY